MFWSEECCPHKGCSPPLLTCPPLLSYSHLLPLTLSVDHCLPYHLISTCPPPLLLSCPPPHTLPLLFFHSPTPEPHPFSSSSQSLFSEPPIHPSFIPSQPTFPSRYVLSLPQWSGPARWDGNPPGPGPTKPEDLTTLTRRCVHSSWRKYSRTFWPPPKAEKCAQDL